MSNR
jgi:hypothetical protein